MELSTIEWSMIAFLVVQLIGGAKSIASQGTRIAVLEAAHDTLQDDLKEIKQDVKQLLKQSTAA